MPLTAGDGERSVAHVLPLTSGARRRAGASYGAAAAVFVHKAALMAPSPPEVIARSYALTPTELRVLLAVVEIGGAPDVAEALGIGETTVRFHLRRCSTRPAPAARPIWSSSWRASPTRSSNSQPALDLVTGPPPFGRGASG